MLALILSEREPLIAKQFNQSFDSLASDTPGEITRAIVPYKSMATSQC